jgi:hypothetical protein
VSEAPSLAAPIGLSKAEVDAHVAKVKNEVDAIAKARAATDAAAAATEAAAAAAATEAAAAAAAAEASAAAEQAAAAAAVVAAGAAEQKKWEGRARTRRPRGGYERKSTLEWWERPGETH